MTELTEQERAQALRQKFVKTFRAVQRKIAVTRSPGRVDLIGGHTDYNEGFVFPAAVNRATWVAAQRRTDTQVWVYSSTVEEQIKFDLRTMRFDPDHGWANYPKGVMHALVNRGWKLEGLNMYIESDVPLGGGMSSSAALECAVAYACLALFPYQLDRLSIVKLCQRAENQFVGVACGIMDQYTSAFGRKGYALFLDCRSLRCEHVPLALDRHRLVVINSRVKHKLASAEYNKRREQCTEAVKLLKPKFQKVRALRDLTVEDLPAALPLLPDIPRKRAEHVVRECHRVTEAVSSLKRGDLASFGKLLNASHASLRDLYEVSCPELNTLVNTAQQVPGVLGARMMGAGFGGCAIALVETGQVEALKRDLMRVYQRQYGTIPPIDEVETADGSTEFTV